MLSHILQAKKPVTDPFRLHALAQELGYSFFAWEGRVYVVTCSGFMYAGVVLGELEH